MQFHSCVRRVELTSLCFEPVSAGAADMRFGYRTFDVEDSVAVQSASSVHPRSFGKNGRVARGEWGRNEVKIHAFSARDLRYCASRRRTWNVMVSLILGLLSCDWDGSWGGISGCAFARKISCYVNAGSN
jgi:hypothetical protein